MDESRSLQEHKVHAAVSLLRTSAHGRGLGSTSPVRFSRLSPATDPILLLERASTLYNAFEFKHAETETGRTVHWLDASLCRALQLKSLIAYDAQLRSLGTAWASRSYAIHAHAFMLCYVHRRGESYRVDRHITCPTATSAACEPHLRAACG